MSLALPDWELTGAAEIDCEKTAIPENAPSPMKGSQAKSATSRHRISVGDGEINSKAEALRALKQSRLRAASCYLSIWWSIISIQSLLTGLPYLPPIVVVLGLAGAYSHLSLRPRIASPGLKLIESGMFALMTGTFVHIQYVITVAAATQADYHSIEIATKNGLINSVTLLLAYTLLIPNTVRSATAAVVCLALYPLVTAWSVFLGHPDVSELIELHRYLEPYGLNLTMAVVSGSLSLYGIHILDTLRQDVFEARRLNQYQLGERLGVGGMGEVYLAEHRLLRRSCAVKMVRPEKSLDRRALALLEREVRSTAQLSHPNIVEVYDYGRTDDGSFYYVMERLQGLNLSELVEQFGPLPAARIIYLLRQACDGLADAHAAGLVHRDLKPDNIFAAQVGRRYDVAKLLDFGLVKQSSLQKPRDTVTHPETNGNPAITISGTLMGTPLFMAPEQGLGDATLQDHRADIYALGAIGYFLATGQPPFEGQNSLKVLHAHTHDAVLPPSFLLPLPDDLERVILRCLEKHPRDRYATAEDLERALAECEAAPEWDCEKAGDWWAEHGGQST